KAFEDEFEFEFEFEDYGTRTVRANTVQATLAAEALVRTTRRVPAAAMSHCALSSCAARTTTLLATLMLIASVMAFAPLFTWMVSPAPPAPPVFASQTS